MEKAKPKFKVEDGVMEDATHRRCTQTKCGFYVNGNCQSCQDCGSSPFILNKNCSRCYGCENVPDELRWGEKNKTQAVKKAVKVPEIVEQETNNPLLEAMDIAINGGRK